MKNEQEIRNRKSKQGRKKMATQLLLISES